MTPTPVADVTDVGGPQLLTWRVTTAVRVFALALATGSAISEHAFTESAPMLLVLACVAAVTSLLDWTTRAHAALHWHAVAEALAVTALMVAADSTSHLGAYLAVPIIVAGVRHGPITALNVTLCSALTAAAMMTLDTDPGSDHAALGSWWLLVGLGVGLLAAWQSRATRDLAARQAPYAAAHQLMLRLHRLATAGSLGLDSTTLAGDLESALRRTTEARRVGLFAFDTDARLRAVLPVEDEPAMIAQIARPASQRSPGTEVVPLRGAHQLLGYAVLAGVPQWDAELSAAVHDLADDFAVRLDTAVLFDEVRLLSATEERTRIARDIHDGVAQEIVALGYVVDEIESVSTEPETRALAAQLREEVTRVVGELRYSIFDLRHVVGEQDLVSSLTDYVHGITRDTDLRVHLVLDRLSTPLPAFAQGELMRIAQEAVGNVRRHAHASTVWVSLVEDGPQVRLEVADDGIGDAAPRDRHWGLQGMAERASGIGADLSIEPRPGGGTLVRVLIPLHLPTPRSARDGHTSPAH